MIRLSVRRHRNISGFTLTELAIVLGIIGTILGGIWTASSMVRANNKNNQAIKEILTIAQNVRALYATRQTIVSGDATASFITSGVFPSDMVNTTTGYTVNPWGTTSSSQSANGVSVSAGGLWACDNIVPGASFAIVFWAVPKSACIAILLNMTGPGATTNGLNCAFSDSTGTVATDGSAESTIETSCGGNVALGFNLK